MGATSESSCWGDAFGATSGAALFPFAGALADGAGAAGGGLVAWAYVTPAKVLAKASTAPVRDTRKPRILALGSVLFGFMVVSSLGRLRSRCWPLPRGLIQQVVRRIRSS